MVSAGITQRKFQRLGFGARLGIVLSVAALGLQVWAYKSNLDDWSAAQECKTVMDADPPPIGFVVLKQTENGSPKSAGNADYPVCSRKPPFEAQDPIPYGCAAVVVRQDDPPVVTTIRGPVGATRAQVELAAARLGLDGETMKILSTPLPVFKDAEAEAKYAACAAKSLSQQHPLQPAFSFSDSSVALSLIWGVYLVGRFLIGK